MTSIDNIPKLDFCIFINENDRGDELLVVHHKPTGYSIQIREDCIRMDAIKDAMATLHINEKIING